MLKLGQDLLRFRSVVTSAEQVKEVEVRGWDIATKKALTATAPAATTRSSCRHVTPPELAKTFGDPTLRGHRRPLPHPGRGRRAAAALAEQIAGAFAEFEGVARGNPKLRAGAAVTIDSLGAPFDGKYTDHHLAAPLRPDHRLHHVLLGDRAPGPQPARPGVGGGRGTRRRPGVVIGQVSDVNDPEKAGRVKLTLPVAVRRPTSATGRAPCRPAPARTAAALVLPEVGDEVLVVFEQGDIRRPVRARRPVQRHRHHAARGPVDWSTAAPGRINRRSFVSRRGHRIDLLDRTGKTEGVTVATSDEQAQA